MVHADTFSASHAMRDQTRLITLAGDLDLATAPSLRSEFDYAVEQAPRAVVLDLSGLTFMDCAALRAVINFADRAKACGWELRIERPAASVAKIFALTGTAGKLPLSDAHDRR